MLSKTREAKGKLKPPWTPHWTLLSSVDTAHGPAFPALDSLVMSLSADHMD